MFVLSGLTAVTVDKDRRIITDAAIVVSADRIADIGKREQILADYAAAEIVDCSGLVAIPGLIDTHCHADQSLLRGLGDRMHLSLIHI